MPMAIMNTMALILIPFFVALIGDSLTIEVLPNVKVTITKIDVNITDNPYFGQWSLEILPPGDKLSAKIPIKKDLPPTMLVSSHMEFNGVVIVDSGAVSLCAAWEDPVYIKLIIDVGLPKKEFPKHCPIKANDAYAINEYTFPYDKIPPDVPEGTSKTVMSVYEEGKDPYVKIYIESELTVRAPELLGR